MIKLIITDMDGTLLHDDKSMPAGTFDLIHALQCARHHFCGRKRTTVRVTEGQLRPMRRSDVLHRRKRRDERRWQKRHDIRPAFARA